MNKNSFRTLVAYFSRPGENYHRGGRIDLAVGNTEVVAGYIADLIPTRVFRIEPVDPYPTDYDATVARNVAEQDGDVRPAITGPLPDLTGVDTLLLGSPIWNVRPPMIMRTFLEALDLTGVTVRPFTTHAMSGLGTAVRDYADSAPGAELGPGLAIQGEQVAAARGDVRAWLGSAGLLPPEPSTTPDEQEQHHP